MFAWVMVEHFALVMIMSMAIVAERMKKTATLEIIYVVVIFRIIYI